MGSDFVKILKNNGYRVTSPRLKIIKEIKTFPLSAKEIHESLDDKKIDLVTVYRTLEILTSLKLISRIIFDKKGVKYESLQDSGHHHHLICEKCGKVRDAEVEDKKILESITKKYNFTINSHTLDVWGICSTCN